MEISGSFSDYSSRPRQSRGLDLNNLKTCLRFPCLGLNPIIDSFSPTCAMSENSLSAIGMNLTHWKLHVFVL